MIRESGYSKELDLIVRCCFEVEDSQILAICGSTIDWNKLFISSLWHKVSFIVLNRLKLVGAIDVALRDGNLPLLLLNHWKQLIFVNEQRNAIHCSAAVEISSVFSHNKIPYAISKGGLAMFERIYSTVERKTYDIDLIANREQMAEIESCMSALGYRIGDYNHQQDIIQPLPVAVRRKWLIHSRGLPNFLRKTGIPGIPYIVVQVQFKIGSTFAGSDFDAASLIDRAVPTQYGSTVCDGDLLLQTILHLNRETSEPSFDEWNMSWNLIKFCDIDRVIKYLHKKNTLEEALNHISALNLSSVALSMIHTVSYFSSCDAIKDAIKFLSGTTKDQVQPPERLDVYRKVSAIGFIDKFRASKWTTAMPQKTS